MRRNRSNGPFVWIAVSWGAFSLGGCGTAWVDNLPRQAVSGKVTMDGAPLSNGTIMFSPATEGPTPALVPIDAGSYSIPKDRGLVPGTYKVSILTSGNAEPEEPTEGPVEPPGPAAQARSEAADKRARAASLGKSRGKDQLIPPQYNTATILTAEVKEGTPNTFHFDLTSAVAPKK